MIGQLIDERYEIVGLLGRGGMATVYLVNDLKEKKKRALKVLQERLSDPVSIKRFKREFQACSRLEHKNIVKMHALGQQANTFYYTMDYLPHPTLAEVLEDEGFLSEERVLALVEEIASAFNHFHSRGLVHRDLKPSNLIIKENGEVVIVDFGLSRDIEMTALTATGCIIGTPQYMSPEQIHGEHVEAATDIWALGAITYEALSGRRAFAADNVQDIMIAIGYAKLEPLSQVAPTLKWNWSKLVEKCLEKDASMRPKDGNEIILLLEELRQFSTDEEDTVRIEKVAQPKLLTRFIMAFVIVLFAFLCSLELSKSKNFSVFDYDCSDELGQVTVNWQSERAYPTHLFLLAPKEKDVWSQDGKAVTKHSITIDGLAPAEECVFRIAFPDGKHSLVKRARAGKLKISHIRATVIADSMSLSLQTSHQLDELLLNVKTDTETLALKPVAQRGNSYTFLLPYNGSRLNVLKLQAAKGKTRTCVDFGAIVQKIVRSYNEGLATFNPQRLASRRETKLTDIVEKSPQFPLYLRAVNLSPLVLTCSSVDIQSRRLFYKRLCLFWDLHVYAVFERKELPLKKPDFGHFEITSRPYGKIFQSISIFAGKPFILGNKFLNDPRNIKPIWQGRFVVPELDGFRLAEFELTVGSLNRTALELRLNNDFAINCYGIPILDIPYASRFTIYQRIPIELLNELANTISLRASQIYRRVTSRKVDVEKVKLRLYR